MEKEKRTAKECFKDLLKLFFIFFKIGLFTFGGGYAMLSLIEDEVVEKQKWISKEDLMDIFAIAESTPGPIAINTATFVGVRRLGVLGGIIASIGVALPSLIIIIAISYVIDLVRDNVWVQYIFKGIRVGVIVLIFRAFLTFFKGIKKDIFSFMLLLAGFLIIFLTNVSVIYVILGAILISAIFVALITYRNNHKFHMKGTPEYYSELTKKEDEE